MPTGTGLMVRKSLKGPADVPERLASFVAIRAKLGSLAMRGLVAEIDDIPLPLVLVQRSLVKPPVAIL